MADTPRISIRLPREIQAALAERAGDLGTSTYAAQVLASHVGLPLNDRSQGFATVAPEKLRRLSRKAAKTRHSAAKK